MLVSTVSFESVLRERRPCLELLCTNILSEMASTGPSTLTVVNKTTYWNAKKDILITKTI